MTQRITKAIFPVAGLGTRFLPATKASPKEMLPIVDKPLIQYAVEEAVAAGIEVMVFITGRNKNAILDHFDKAYELETELINREKTEVLKIIRDIVPSHVSCVYIRQAEALGLGHAVQCAESIINNEPFAVILADDLIDNGSRGCLQQMVEIFERESSSILAVEKVPPQATVSYGIVKINSSPEIINMIEGIVEKPKPENAPSDLGVVGRYILTPAIFDHIKQIGKGSGGEIQLTDAIASLLKQEPVLAYQFAGKRYDCGSKLGYLIATVEYGLQHGELNQDFKKYLKQLASELNL